MSGMSFVGTQVLVSVPWARHDLNFLAFDAAWPAQVAPAPSIISGLTLLKVPSNANVSAHA